MTCQEDRTFGHAQEVYGRKPIGFHQGIPVFSNQSNYTENYGKISEDHLASLRAYGTNPFIEEEHWVQIENSTKILVEKYANAGDMILDAGVGLGRLLSQLPTLRRYGVDISFGYLLEAQNKGIEVCYALIEEMPYVDGIFDLVVCTDVLEHVLNFDACLIRILSVLKPGGTLIIRVPYKESLGPYTQKGYPYRYAHIRNFDEYSLALQLTRCFGCEILDFTYELYLANTARFRFRLPTILNGKMQRGLLAAVKKVRRRSYHEMLKALVEPTIINVVVRKPNG